MTATQDVTRRTVAAGTSGAEIAIAALEANGVDVVFGIPGVRVKSPDALVREIQAAVDRDLPTIIDVPIEPWV